ncbi:uncharacterized protein BJ212DRAFT_1304369 [Suillus subaureus]|uniref:Uncharacterized protein n=1 Tax=Suillus subaureus TaxID=48587 RepID=A0A9P7DVX7_9AGAM|nr:uncharacterized protein BJ212DRAFT_1304369 [Suillus subaureus]KAG1804250.1 hypothetical protein BJ212DRAFT_1304369 [Suillus subaureus]
MSHPNQELANDLELRESKGKKLQFGAAKWEWRGLTQSTNVAHTNFARTRKNFCPPMMVNLETKKPPRNKRNPFRSRTHISSRISPLKPVGSDNLDPCEKNQTTSRGARDMLLDSHPASLKSASAIHVPGLDKISLSPRSNLLGLPSSPYFWSPFHEDNTSGLNNCLLSEDVIGITANETSHGDRSRSIRVLESADLRHSGDFLKLSFESLFATLTSILRRKYPDVGSMVGLPLRRKGQIAPSSWEIAFGRIVATLSLLAPRLKLQPKSNILANSITIDIRKQNVPVQDHGNPPPRSAEHSDASLHSRELWVPVDRDSVRAYDLGNSGVLIDGIEPQNHGGGHYRPLQRLDLR